MNAIDEPRLREIRLSQQVGFTEIDLRWGVTEEESRNGATVEICLKEIDRCRDFPIIHGPLKKLKEEYGSWLMFHKDVEKYHSRNRAFFATLCE